MKRSGYVLAVALLAGCSQQQPAPVVEGFGQSIVEEAQRGRASEVYDSKDIPVYDAKDTPVIGSSIVEEEAAPLADTSSFNGSGDVDMTYTVKKGDTLYAIAEEYNTTPDQVIALNSLKPPYILMVGQTLHLPLAAAQERMAKESQNGYALTQKAKSQPAVAWETPGTASNSTPETVDDPDILPEQSKPKYSFHKVKSGENLFRIGQKYGVSFIDIMAMNDIERPADLKTGAMLKIPVAGSTVSTYEQEEAIETTFTEADKKRLVAKYAKTKGLIWPVKGTLLKKYGAEDRGVNNTGINIEAEEGAPVLAAEDGTVIYANDGLNSYGNLVLLRHKRGYVTAYGHLAQILVRKGESVAKGQMVGTVGHTGNVSNPQLHFEVRRNARAVDPLQLLPR